MKPSDERLAQRCLPILRPALDFHCQQWLGCQGCELCQTATRHVLWRGYCPADLLIIGEAPGDSEDVNGLPFVGPAGRYLDMILSDLGQRRHEAGEPDLTFCVTNTVACRPPKNAGGKQMPPKPKQIDACRRRVREFIALVQPKIIVLAGKIAQSYAPKIERLNVFPRSEDWPLWAFSEFNQSWIQALRDSQGGKQLPPQEWKPAYVEIHHPSYILRQSNEEDQQTEIDRAVLRIQAGITEFVTQY